MRLLNWVMSMMGRRKAKSKANISQRRTYPMVKGVGMTSKVKLPDAIKNADELIVTRSAGNVYVSAIGNNEKYPYSRGLLHSILDNKPNIKMRAEKVPRSVVRGIEIEAKSYKRKKETLRGMTNENLT